MIFPGTCDGLDVRQGCKRFLARKEGTSLSGIRGVICNGCKSRDNKTQEKSTENRNCSAIHGCLGRKEFLRLHPFFLISEFNQKRVQEIEIALQ